MVKKVSKSSARSTESANVHDSASATDSGSHLAGAVRESAQQIWLAGLGAFSRAQEGGGKVFETLVQQGLNIQRKTQSAAEEKITEATQRVASMASDIQSRATGQWDKLEGIFEERVSRALNKLGVPSAKDVDALIARIDELSRLVEQMGAPARVAPKAASAKKAAAPKTAPAKAEKPAPAKPAKTTKAAKAVKAAPAADAAEATATAATTKAPRRSAKAVKAA